MESTALVETPATISYAKVVAPASVPFKTGAAAVSAPPAVANKLEGAVEAVELSAAPVVAGDGEEDESFRFVFYYTLALTHFTTRYSFFIRTFSWLSLPLGLSGISF